ncbi:MAG TPA: hypothetical protein DCQ36_03210 [Actinobacteria bacterium]|nr:hypothetical protein [Actinomycetota bacterium]
MAELVIHHASALVTDWREPALRDGWLLIADGLVRGSGTGAPPAAGESLNASGLVVMPGFVAAHHHLYQGVSRGVHAPGGLIDWLDVHYRAWARMTAEDVGTGALVSSALAALGGCTTIAGFEYLHPAGEDFVSPVVDAVDAMGLRLLYVRGCAPRLEGPLVQRLEKDGVDVSRLVETESLALQRTAEVLARPTHDRLRWAAGPTTPVVDDGGSFNRALDQVAQEAGTSLHTHFHPIPGTVLEGESAFEMAERVGLVRAGNWLAHGSRLAAADVARFGSHQMGVVHNPSCSALLGYPTPPLVEWMSGNDRVAVSVDGAASNDRGGMLAETQLAWHMQRARFGIAADGNATCTPRMVLDAATRGAARAINWDGLGVLSPGSQADIAAWSIRDVGFAGSPQSALTDLEWLLFRCYSGQNAQHVFVGGEPVVLEGRLVGADLDSLVQKANQAATRLYG